MTTYIIVEHDNKKIKPATLSTLTAANQLNQPIVPIVIGYQCQAVAEIMATMQGVTKILLADHELYQHPLAERLTPLILSVIQNTQYLLAPATTFGKNLLPRIAAKLSVPQVSDVIEIVSSDTFSRPIYAGNAIETVKVLVLPIILSIRATAFPAQLASQTPAPIERVNFISDNQQAQFIAEEQHNLDRPDLSSAEIVVSGGRGLQDKENFQKIMLLANRLGAAVGASRAAVDMGLAPNDCQVGQTGQVVAPKLYFAIGISGAIQHLAGMKDSKIIVAINKDPEAPIFQVANYGIVADLNEVMREWDLVLTDMGY